MERPEGIILTIPKRFFAEYPGGEDRFRAVMEAMNHPASTVVWNQTISAFPKHEVLYAYLCFGGKIQYRCTLAGFDSGDKAFVDKLPGQTTVIREHRNKKWALLCGPVVGAPTNIPQKGFQGFRYTKQLF